MVNFICPVLNARLTSPFGWRNLGYGREWHQGVDLCDQIAGKKVPVYASADGKVTRSGLLSSYGNVVMIVHTINGKTYETNYAHLDSFCVKVGQYVKQGQRIGITGMTGRSFGVHLHFEIHNGRWKAGQPNAVNPMKYISLLNSNQENGDELTMSQYNELKEMITVLQKENTELKKQLANKIDKQESREPLKYHVDDWQWMKANGITDGSNPQNYITREQVSTLLHNMDKFNTKKFGK
ncbi:M23 family metallopeptidase [Lysinibacillus sp. FSL K6-0057]|uniref:M23 family metallopeptidase n=1 Tax=Lysinibacillus sp. FSL K6-0057 TaxID=2921411 RepID=UPI003159CBFE